MQEKNLPNTSQVDTQNGGLKGFPVGERQALLAIMEKANAASLAESMDAFVERMLELMLEVAAGESGVFSEYDEQTDELVIRVVSGDFESENLRGMRIKRQEVLPGAAKAAAQLPIAGDLPTNPRWLRAVNPFLAAQMINVISLPLEHQNNLLGLVQIYNSQDCDLDVLITLGSRMAVEMKRWQQVESSMRGNKQMHGLVHAMEKITGTLDREKLLNLVMENASRLVDAERVSLFLVDPSTHETMFHVSYNAPEDEEDNSIYAGKNSRWENSKPAQPCHAPRIQNEFNFLTRSAVTVPITTSTLDKNDTGTSAHVLGGLMALNKRGSDFQEYDAWMLEVLARQASTYLQAVDIYEGTEELFVDVTRALVAAIDAKDSYTQGHSQRVSDYSVMIAEKLGMTGGEIYDVRISSLMHDVGKIGIPDAILKKMGQLTPEEMAVMKTHPNMGMNILGKVKMLEGMLPGIFQHHERLDGSGYPLGLVGNQISVQGRIVAVADVFDAMTSTRPYRPAVKVAEVMTYLREYRGVSFDPMCVDALDEIVGRFGQAAEKKL